MAQDIDPSWTGERFLPSVGGDIALEHFHRYALAQLLATNKRVLDIACGEGYGASMLAEVAASVIGVDIDPATVARAAATYMRSNLRFIQGSCTSLDLPDSSVDLVVSFETLEHHSEHDAMLAELRRVLVPEGILVISTPDRRYYSDDLKYTNPFHVRELYAEEFVQLMRAHFPHVIFSGQRIAYGSFVIPTDGAGEFVSFSMSADGMLARPGFMAPVYLIAVASARPISPIPASVFDATKAHVIELNLLRQDLQVARDILSGIHSSLYWRLAAPIRLLRKTLRRIRGH